MNTFALESTSSSGRSARNFSSAREPMRLWLVVLVVAAVGCYLLPWLVNPAASLSPNGYDLAEWTSLVAAQTPPLLTTLLLRLPLVCIALIAAFRARRSLLAGLIVLLTAAALLPPEIIPLTGNPNSIQQGALALVTLIGGIVGWIGVLPRYRRGIAAVIALVGAGASLVGVAQAYQLMRNFQLPTEFGIGGAALAVVFVIAAVVVQFDKPNRAAVELP